jgi:hypothetical protein
MPQQHGGSQPVTTAALLDDHHNRLTDLERRTVAAATGRIPWAFCFSVAGLLATGDLLVLGKPVYITGRLHVVRFQPQVAGSTTTTVQVKRNGTALTALNPASSTVTLPASSTAETTALFGGDNHLFARLGTQAPDRINITLVTVGTGASGLEITCEFT